MSIKHKFKVLDEVFEKDLTPVQAIKLHCLDCSGGSKHERRNCIINDCPLYPFRTGYAHKLSIENIKSELGV